MCVEMYIFRLKSGKDLENQAANLHQEFTGVPPRGQGLSKKIKLQKKISSQNWASKGYSVTYNITVTCVRDWPTIM